MDERTRVAKSEKAADRPFFFFLLFAFILLAVATRISARHQARVQGMEEASDRFKWLVLEYYDVNIKARVGLVSLEKKASLLSRNFALFVTLRFWCEGSDLRVCERTPGVERIDIREM